MCLQGSVIMLTDMKQLQHFLNIIDINISPQHPLSVPYHTNFVHTLFISEDVLKICCTTVVVVVFVQEMLNDTPLMLLLLGDLFLGPN